MKNVILVITDTFRFDNLFDYAERPINTPMLDSFIGERATSVENFFAGSFPTIPHRTDVARGVLGWPHYGWQPLDQSGPNHIARILGHQGYATQLICDCPHLFNNNFQAGFTAAFQHRGQEGDKHLLHLNDPISETVPLNKTRQRPLWQGRSLADQHRWLNRYYNVEDQMFSAQTSATAVKWLEENYEAEPFFLWVDFFDPHEPWDAPEYMVRRYDPNYSGDPMIHCNYGLATDYSPDELTNLWAHYAAEAELVDRHIGRLLQKIDDLNLWDDTIVIVTSDHGTSIGEHNRTGKSNISDSDERYWPIYPEVGHVPFLIAGGDVARGRKCSILAQPIDILPTLSELAGFKTSTRVPIEGMSFAKCLRGHQDQHRDLAVTATFINPENDGTCPQRAVTPFVADTKWGLAPLGANGSTELYDLQVDPTASQDVSNTNPETVREMRRRFIEYMTNFNMPKHIVDCWST